MRVSRSEEQLVAVHRHAAIVWSATATEVVRHVAAVSPNLPSRSRINGPRVPAEAGDVQHVVDEQRRRLEIWSETSSGTSTAP